MKQPKRWGGVGALLAIFITGGCLPSLAAELPGWATGSEPIQIDSHSLEARADEGLVVFQGEVVARQGDMTLQADRVSVFVDPSTSEVRSADAAGNVRVQRQDVVATGQEGKYDVSQGVVELSGDAKAWRGRNVVAGDRIILYLAEDRIVVEGAKAVFVPGEQPLPGQ